MDLKQLEYFVAVVDLGGFSPAARLLRVAQPAISRQVRGLELELRQALLVRNGRGAVPTEAGKRLADHARSILLQVERARREVDDVKGAPVGHVVVAMPPTLALALTTPIVHAFRKRFPRATLSIAEALSATIHEWVVVGRADIGLLYNPASSQAIELVPLADEDLFLIGRAPPRGTPRTVRLRDLPRYPLVIPSRPHAIRTLVEARLASFGLRPQVALEIDAIGPILELVAEGQGYAILSARAAHGALARNKLTARRIVQPAMKSALALAVAAQRPTTPLQSATVALLAELVPPALAPS